MCMKCFGCGMEGHLIRSCPERKEAGPTETPTKANTNNVDSVGPGRDTVVKETGEDTVVKETGWRHGGEGDR